MSQVSVGIIKALICSKSVVTGNESKEEMWQVIAGLHCTLEILPTSAIKYTEKKVRRIHMLMLGLTELMLGTRNKKNYYIYYVYTSGKTNHVNLLSRNQNKFIFKVGMLVLLGSKPMNHHWLKQWPESLLLILFLELSSS